jgi:thiaminase
MDRMNHDYRRKYIRVQHLITYRTTSSEAICVVTAMTPITIKVEEIVKRYSTNKRKNNELRELDHEV